MMRSWFVLTFLLFVVGCGNQHLVANTQSQGRLTSDTCGANADQASCGQASGCAWIAPVCPAGAKCPPGVCYQPDPCLTLGDSAACNANPKCSWSQAAQLCPLGANCDKGGYCHPRAPDGGGCSCVTPLFCPKGATCPPPECDCDGGGSGGGTCTCACPACPPGSFCPPCDCKCAPSGCVSNGTCTCGCPPCAPGEKCPPCSCGCGSGGAVSVPPALPSGPAAACGTHTDQASCVADTADKCQWLIPPCAPGAPCPTGICQLPAPAPIDPCSAHKQLDCTADTANHCDWIALGAPCQPGMPCTSSGVCQMRPSSGCGCACPPCPPGGPCMPCGCSCGDPSGGCNPPPLPPTATGTPCPAIGCATKCPSGYKKDAAGCSTCECV